MSYYNKITQEKLEQLPNEEQYLYTEVEPPKDAEGYVFSDFNQEWEPLDFMLFNRMYFNAILSMPRAKFKDTTFVITFENLRAMEDGYNVGLRLGLTEGKVLLIDATLPVTKDELELLLADYGTLVHRYEAKRRYLLEEFVQNRKTENHMKPFYKAYALMNVVEALDREAN